MRANEVSLNITLISKCRAPASSVAPTLLLMVVCRLLRADVHFAAFGGSLFSVVALVGFEQCGGVWLKSRILGGAGKTGLQLLAGEIDRARVGRRAGSPGLCNAAISCLPGDVSVSRGHLCAQGTRPVPWAREHHAALGLAEASKRTQARIFPRTSAACRMLCKNDHQQPATGSSCLGYF